MHFRLLHDRVLVRRNDALQDAASVAAVPITTEALVANKPKKSGAAAAAATSKLTRARPSRRPGSP